MTEYISKKNSPTIALTVLYADNGYFYTDIEKYILPTFQSTTSSLKKKVFLMICIIARNNIN